MPGLGHRKAIGFCTLTSATFSARNALDSEFCYAFSVLTNSPAARDALLARALQPQSVPCPSAAPWQAVLEGLVEQDGWQDHGVSGCHP